MSDMTILPEALQQTAMEPTQGANLLPTVPMSGEGINPQYQQDILAWLEAMMEMNEIREKIKALAAQLTHMKNVMYGVIEIMNMFQDYQGSQIKALSAVDNLDSDIRAGITGAQNAFNQMGDYFGIQELGPKGSPNPNPQGEAKKIIEFVKQMEALLKEIKTEFPNLMDNGSINNLQNALNGIKGAFGKDWGDPNKMSNDVGKWMLQPSAGGYCPQLKDVQDSFQTLNQSVSALSTTTNTQLGYVAEQVKQMLGIEQSGIQSYQQLLASSIQNQKSA